jgi:PAS domain S-box-containing protein
VPYYIDYTAESYRFIGEAIGRLTGYPAEEITPTLLGQMIKETVMTGQGNALPREAAIRQARTGDLANWNADYRLVDRSGQTHWLSDSSIQVLDEHGKPIGAIGILQDITERKRLEEQIRESLVRRGTQVRTSTEVAQEIASATDLNELFGRVVTLIKERFDYYHAQLFRYEPEQNAVVLITGYGEIGQKMLTAGHQLPMGRGVVGTAAFTGKSILATDVRQDADWRPNPHLPQTQGELAVPIKWRDQMLGILDVQSDRAGVLTDDDRLLLEGLCGQIAIAMESKRLLDTVQQSEQLMRTLIDAIPDYIYAKDSQGCHMLGNAALTRLYGLASPAELLGKTDFDFYPRELAEQYQASEMPVLREGQSLLRHEELNINADGRERWNSTTKVPLRDPQGQIIGLVGITSDITQRKLAAQDLLRFKLGLEQASDAIFMTDVTGHITYVNPAFERIYGFTREEALGQTPRILKSGQVSAEYYQTFWQTLLNKQSISGEKPNKTKDGRVIIVEDSNSPILDEARNLLGFLSTHRDITERKRAEQQMEETLRETERLYAAVSHESWQAHRQTGSLGDGYLFDQALIHQADNVWEPEIAQALEQQALVAACTEQRAVAVSPLSVRGEAIGALGVYDDPAHPLSKDDLQLITAVSEQVALALESARLFDQTQRDAERERTLSRIATAISRSSSVNELLPTALDVTLELIGFDCGLATLFDTETNALRIIVQRDLPEGLAKRLDNGLGGTLCEYVFVQGRATFLEDMRQGAPLDVSSLLAQGLLSYAGIPLIYQDRVLGTLCMFSHAPSSLGEKMDVLLQSIGQQIGVGVTNARLFEQTQRDAEREHTINRVTSRIRSARSVDEVLSIAAQELRLATRASRSVVEILPAHDQPARTGNGEGVKA